MGTRFQAAIELEQIADRGSREKYELVVSEDGSIIRPQKINSQRS